ncbi:MAG: hypothetical protein ACKVQQ_08550 [Burkholderiales bacterium]
MPPTPLNDLARAIGARGFRKWYEGRLVESHLYLVATFLCLILLIAAIEQGGPYNQFGAALVLLAASAIVGGLGLWCMRRYFTILETAQFMSERSECPQCQTYGRFEVLYTGPREDPEGDLSQALADLPLLFVRCRKCAARWTM